MWVPWLTAVGKLLAAATVYGLAVGLASAVVYLTWMEVKAVIQRKRVETQ